MVNFQPLFDRVLIEQIEQQQDSSIVLPDAYVAPSKEGIVVAIGTHVVLGNEVRLVSSFVNVGDKVLFGEYSHEKIEVDGKPYLLVRVQELRGKRIE